MGNNTSLKNSKVARIATVSMAFAAQLRVQLVDMRDQGMDITLISGSDYGIEVLKDLNFKHCVINFARDIDLFRDMTTLLQLFWLFLRDDFTIVHSTTPKAGLLTSIAGWLARIPVRIHTFTGQPWANLSGFKRWVCIVMDRIIIKLNTKVYADSNSQVDYLLKNKVISKLNTIEVLGKGSLIGVDLDRFSSINLTEKKLTRKELDIPENSFVFILLGRLNFDKGAYELLDAFSRVVEKYSHSFLLLVGPIDEQGNDLLEIIKKTNRLKQIDYTDVPEIYMSVADVLCAPSHREGFGTTVLEAAAMGITSIGSNIVGLQESIKHNETGILFEKGNIEELANIMIMMIEDQELKQRLERKAQANVMKYYASNIVNGYMIREYRKLIS